MSCSCEATVELLMQSTAPLTLREAAVALPFEGLPVYSADAEKDKLRHSLLAALATPKEPLAQKLLRVASLCGCENTLPSLSREEALGSMQGVLLILSRHSKSVRDGAEAAISYLQGAENEPNGYCRLFNEAEKRLYRRIPHAEELAARLIANHILYEGFPYVPDCQSVDTALAALLMAAGALKTICVCAMADKTALSDLVDLFASVNRFIEHSDYYAHFGRLCPHHAADALSIVLPILQNTYTPK